MPEKYTIMVVPKSTAKMRKFQISKRTIQLFIGVIFLFVTISSFFIYSYFDYRIEASAVPSLRMEYNKQKTQLQTLAQTIAGLKKDMGRLSKFNRKFRTIMGLPQAEDNIQQSSGMGGGVEDTFLEFAKRRENAFIKQLKRDLSQITSQIQDQQESLQDLSEVIEDKKSLLVCTPSIWPCKGWLTSGFGYRNSPFTGQREMHKGLDIAARFGQPIKAPADGVITYAGRKGGLGKVVVIEHGYGYSTRLGHSSKIVVKVGDRIKRNQVIAYVGNTGRSTGPHLHYEIRVNGVPVNPFNYLLD